MAGSERDLVLALRAELAAIDPSRACDREAERAGLDPAGRRREPTLARLAVRLARREGGGRPAPAGPAARPAPGGRGTPPRRVPGTAALPAVEPFDWAARPDHCRMAWLRGRFLSQGSLSFTNGRTHLELVVGPDEAPALAANLAAAGMQPSWRIRRGRGVVTWKSAETVNVVLRRIGAGPSLLELEARQVVRTLRGELNRVLNAESANLARTVSAAGRQLEAIDTLAADGRLAEEPATVRSVAAARRDTPEATLGELAERLALHRSAVQRALERLERLALRAPG
jgi:WhiA C-terminal HTH domain/WhiA LAGLIDADG-like domain